MIAATRQQLAVFNTRHLPSRLLLVLLALLSLARLAEAHPMPNSLVVLDLHPGGVAAELQLPLGELQAAFGHEVALRPETLVARLGPELRAYLGQHVRPVGADGRPWRVSVRAMQVQAAEQTATGPYQELSARLWLEPATGARARAFTLYYDVIVHQVVTHAALVSVRRDWEAGRVDDSQLTEVGVIRLDVPSNRIPPLVIDQAGQGSWWHGFRGMLALGIRHIAEGTDHLMFLLVLLLPAPLLARPGRWGRFGGTRYSLLRLLAIVTAFTLGHSLTLLAGALGWLHLPARLVEILIAASILVSAVHAWRPLFPSREAYVAAGFGLIHGLAFAGTLANLHLAAGPLFLSILGFNLGIELMQLFVIGLTVPWLLLLSRTTTYPLVRVGGAICAGLAALAWLVERAFLPTSPFSGLIESVAAAAPWLLAVLVAGSVGSYWLRRLPDAPAAR